MPKQLTATALQRIAGLEAFPQPSIIPLSTPVVLMHGFGMGATFRRGGHLHEEAMYLRTRGIRAYAPNVAAYNTVDARSSMWLRRIAPILDETRSDRIIIIAHSMGGLDARHLIHNEGLHEVVDVLITVSTPHRGSSIANLVLEQPSVVRNWMMEMADWLGKHALEDATANALQAITQLTPSYLNSSFNPETPDHPDVEYWSFAGHAGKGTEITMDPVLRFLNAYLYDREGPNDGFVSVDSARWGTFCGTVEADHARQVGFQSKLGGATFDSNGFYATIADKLYNAGY
ncbi:lipase [Longibacter salinarum]|uniref:Lipase n=1 Tax=Longibacter salinarum TaxID=1850348 RepID=A0A2A8CWI4_9BACT|nr:alpha/beta fold hydrolase [Longibacter salinarum]PEN12954.1 lipase [Longibacter salinarum]